MNMNKKKYISPVAEEIEFCLNAVIAQSMELGGEDDRGGSDEEILSNEYRGSWNDIWGGM